MTRAAGVAAPSELRVASINRCNPQPPGAAVQRNGATPPQQIDLKSWAEETWKRSQRNTPRNTPATSPNGDATPAQLVAEGVASAGVDAPTAAVLPGPWPGLTQARRLMDRLVAAEWTLDLPVPPAVEAAAGAAFAARDLGTLRRVVAAGVVEMADAAGAALVLPATCPGCQATLPPGLVDGTATCGCGCVVLPEVTR